MANLSNINNVLRTNSLGVGINRDPLGVLEVSSATKSGIKMFNTGASGRTYETYVDASGNYIIYDVDADRNDLVISDGGDATFAENVGIGGAPDQKLTLKDSGSLYMHIDRTSGAQVYLGATDAEGLLTTSNSFPLIIKTNNTTALTIDTSQNSIFTENVTLSGLQKKIIFNTPYRYIQDARSGADYLTIAQNSFAAGIQLGFDDTIGGGFGATMTIIPSGQTNNAGNVGIGTTTPDAILNISKTSFSTTFTSADSYIRIGKGENATNGYQFIGFGYNNGSADLVPAYIGYQQTGTPGNYTKGDLVFGTRNVTTNTAPTERMRIDSAGDTTFAGSVTASDTSKIEKAQITTQFDTSSFLRLHPSATTDSGGYTNMIFGTSTVNNYGVAIGGLRAGTDGTPSFSIRMLNDSITGTEVLRIASNGLITIDSSIVLDDNEGLFWGATSGTNEYIVSNGADLQFGTGGTERMRITSAGYVHAGNTAVGNTYHEFAQKTTNAQWTLTTRNTTALPYGLLLKYDTAPNNSDQFPLYFSDSVGAKFYMTSNGAVYNNGTYGTISDKKLKENIEDATPKLNDIDKLKVRNFNFKNKPEEKHIGFIAQEFEEVFPKAVETKQDRDSDGKIIEDSYTKTIKTSILIPMLVKAIQELKAEIEILKNK
jgi:hypothetical protein